MRDNQSELLTLQSLSVGYRVGRGSTRTLVRGLNLGLKTGELVCLLGPNGAGKSTLIRAIAGMEKPLSGRVLFDGQDVKIIPSRELAKRLGVVLTDRITVGMLSAYALVALGRYPHTNWAGTLTAHDEEVIADALDTVGATDLADRYLGELSDGERQKVMVARALAQEPDVLVLDEITAFLDLPHRVDIMRLLRHMAEENGKAILLSTHDLDLALRSADKVWLLSKTGRFEIGSPEDLVLNGAFETAFAAEAIEFDRGAGHFKIQQGDSGEIGLIGSGLEAVWTERALKRVGFRVVHDGGATVPIVEIVANNGKISWRLTEDRNRHSSFDSLYDLTAALRTDGRVKSEQSFREL